MEVNENPSVIVTRDMTHDNLVPRAHAASPVKKLTLLLGPEGGRVEDSRRRFFFPFFSCCDLVIIDFFGNFRRAIKLVLNSPTRLSTVVSVGLLRMRYESKL